MESRYLPLNGKLMVVSPLLFCEGQDHPGDRGKVIVCSPNNHKLIVPLKLQEVWQGDVGLIKVGLQYILSTSGNIN